MLLRNFLRVIGAGVILVGLTSCYRPSDEYLKSKGQEGAEVADTPKVSDAERKQAEEERAANPPVVGGAGGVEKAGGQKRPREDEREMGEADMIDLFARNELEALPELDKALSRTPSKLEPLLRGAFAGVGNDTEKCQEILLYLVVRYPKMAGQIAATAGKLNPEIQSWRQ